jgi:hypothetical protein
MGVVDRITRSPKTWVLFPNIKAITMSISRTDVARADLDGYLATIDRLEPEIHMIDTGAGLASIAISLKRIADALDEPNEYGEKGVQALARAISNLKG